MEMPLKYSLSNPELGASPVAFSLVVPCYLDAPHLKRNALELASYLSLASFKWEILFVEDGSPDNTREAVYETVAELQRRGHAARALFHPVNMGRGKAVTDGILAARGQVVGFIDIDLEHRMDSLLPMIRKVIAGEADVVVGKRAIVNGLAKPLRVICSHAYRLLAHLLLDLPVSDTECGLKVFDRRKILPVVAKTLDPRWFWDTEVVHRSYLDGLTVAEHSVLFVEDPSKRSTVRLIPDVIAYLRAILRHRRSV